MKKVIAVVLVFFSAALSIIALATSSPRATLHGSKPSWANPSNYVGRANASDQL